MDERVCFISRLNDGESMSELCREFGISRKTGYKFLHRYQGEGPVGLRSRSSRPQNLINTTDKKTRNLILKAKTDRPSWGAAKLRVLLKRDHPALYFPSKNTIHAILESEGLVKKRNLRRRHKMSGTDRKDSLAANDLWCADYKGQFRLTNQRYCYPLTISDHKSRFLLACDSHDSTKAEDAFHTFRETFAEYGIPKAIRTDNGSPFASAQALHYLTQLSVWWMKLGIEVERSDPGCPQQNGRHERIHLTMKIDPVIQSPQQTHMKQQDAFDLFRKDYNEKRPHESLDMKTPSDNYQPYERKLSETLEEPSYPDCDKTTRVTGCGSIYTMDSRFFLSTALAHQCIGLKNGEDDIWTVKFMNLELGHFDKHNELFHRNDR